MRRLSATITICALTAGFVATPVVGSSAQAPAAEVKTEIIEVSGVVDSALEDPTAVLAVEPSDGVRLDDASSSHAEESLPEPSPTQRMLGLEPSSEINEDELGALTELMHTAPFMLAGITWDAAATQDIRSADARVFEDGEWTEWASLELLPVQPGDDRAGTEPLISSGATGVQVRVLTETGEAPDGLEVTLVDPGSSETDNVAQPTGPASSASAHTAQVLRPTIIARESWMGAGQEKYTTWKSDYSARLDAMYLHHTAGTNSYTSTQGPGIVRSIYKYHADSLGWGDIGYQFLVDKYGNIYEGRHDAIEALPVGAQAGGYNTGTIGVSALGNYDVVKPTTNLINAVVSVFAWKAYQHGLDPRAKVKLLTGTSSKSSLKASIGSWVTVPTILAHRDTNYTACPGQYLYSHMAKIRTDVAAKVSKATETYGSYIPALKTPVVKALPNASAPVLLSDTLEISWNAVPNATRYHVLTRAASSGKALGRDNYWALHKNVTTNSATLTFAAGQTRYIAVRAVNASGHSFPVKIHQVTRPVLASSATASSGWTNVVDAQSYGGKYRRASVAGKTLEFASVSATRKLDIVGPAGPDYGSFDVFVGNAKVGSVNFNAASITNNAVRTISSSKDLTGKVRLQSAGKSKYWAVSGAAFRPVEQGKPSVPATVSPLPTKAPDTPKTKRLSDAHTPVSLDRSVTFKWSAVENAVAYEFGVKEASFNKPMASSVRVVSKTSGTSATYEVKQGKSTRAYVRAVGANGLVSKWAWISNVHRPVTLATFEQEAGKWSQLPDARYFRGLSLTTKSKGARIRIHNVKDITKVGVTVGTSSGAGRLGIYAGDTLVSVIDTKGSPRQYRQTYVVDLPEAHSGRMTVKSLDAKVVRVSAVTLIK